MPDPQDEVTDFGAAGYVRRHASPYELEIGDAVIESSVEFGVADSTGAPMDVFAFARQEGGVDPAVQGITQSRIVPVDGDPLAARALLEAERRGRVFFDPNAPPPGTPADAAGGGQAPGQPGPPAPGTPNYGPGGNPPLPYRIETAVTGPSRGQVAAARAASANLGQNLAAIRRTYDLQRQAEESRGAVAEGAGDAMGTTRFAGVQAAQRINAIHDARREEVEQELRRVSARYDQAREAIAAREISPERWWANRDTGSKILSVVGLFIGSMAQGRGLESNPVLDLMERAIQRDLDAQMAQANKDVSMLGLEQNLMEFLRRRGLDVEAARAAALEQSWQSVEQQVAGLAAQAAGTDRAAALRALGQEIERKKLEAERAVLEQIAAQARRALRTRQSHFITTREIDPETGQAYTQRIPVTRETAERFLLDQSGIQARGRETRATSAMQARDAQGAQSAAATARDLSRRAQNIAPLGTALTTLLRQGESGQLDIGGLSTGRQALRTMVGGARGEFLARAVSGEQQNITASTIQMAISAISKVESGQAMTDTERAQRAMMLVGSGSPEEVWSGIGFMARRYLDDVAVLMNNPDLDPQARNALSADQVRDVARLYQYASTLYPEAVANPRPEVVNAVTAPPGTYGPAPEGFEPAGGAAP